MTYTYTDKRVPSGNDWLPLAVANGMADEQIMPAHDRSNLYSWRTSLVSAVLYRIGRWVARVWTPWD